MLGGRGGWGKGTGTEGVKTGVVAWQNLYPHAGREAMLWGHDQMPRPEQDNAPETPPPADSLQRSRQKSKSVLGKLEVLKTTVLVSFPRGSDQNRSTCIANTCITVHEHTLAREHEIEHVVVVDGCFCSMAKFRTGAKRC